MILRWLKLENIRSYTNEKIEFPEGSVLLSGDVGSVNLLYYMQLNLLYLV
jgi:recombinational DNA repair ATPase RecF